MNKKYLKYYFLKIIFKLIIFIIIHIIRGSSGSLASLSGTDADFIFSSCRSSGSNFLSRKNQSIHGLAGQAGRVWPATQLYRTWMRSHILSNLVTPIKACFCKPWISNKMENISKVFDIFSTLRSVHSFPFSAQTYEDFIKLSSPMGPANGVLKSLPKHAFALTFFQTLIKT